MRILSRAVMLCVVFAALIVYFRVFAPTAAEASWDEHTMITLKLADGEYAELTMAEYLPCALAAEMPIGFGQEALKAQAVAIRTYVLSARRHDDADICADSACCLAYMTPEALAARWGEDSEENMAAARAAAADTDGEYLAYGGQAIQAVFHASSAGRTEASADLWAGVPYLVSVESPENEENTPGLITAERFSPEELAERLGLTSDEPPETWLGAEELDGAGRVRSLTLCGETFGGAFLRSALGLRSTAFSASYDGADFVFTVAGNGHGIGLSQYGAKLLAAQGWSYRDILAHYYPGTVLTSALS